MVVAFSFPTIIGRYLPTFCGSLRPSRTKPLLHGCVCFHVAAVGAILIQLKFQSDKVEFILEITAMLF